MNIARVSSAANDLGESPYWDLDARRLYWIDARRTRAHALDRATGETWCCDLAIEGPSARGLPEPRFGA